jgi:hypothetical protein
MKLTASKGSPIFGFFCFIALVGCGSPDGKPTPPSNIRPWGSSRPIQNRNPVTFLANMKRLPAALRIQLFTKHPDLLPNMISQADPATAAELEKLAPSGAGLRAGLGAAHSKP